MTPPLDGQRIEALLRASGLDVAVRVAAVTASTNDDARAASAAGLAGPAAFLAEEQTAGRGRAGARWHLAPRASLALSVLLHVDVEPPALAPLTLAVGAAVAEVVASLAPGRVQVKWPNDVWLDGKKLAGLLLEGQIRGERVGSVVAGLGLNVGGALPPELERTATSLAAAGVQVDRDALAARAIEAIVRAARRFEEGGVAASLPWLRARDALLGRALRIDDVSGVGAGIDDQGRLLVAGGGGTIPVVAGHVELLDP